MSEKEISKYLSSEDADIEFVLNELLKIDGMNKNLLARIIFGVDPGIIIQEMFMGYKQRKQRKQLYSSDNTLPTTLITLYYEFSPNKISFERLKSAFVSRYIKEESKLEGVHNDAEVEGLRAMYEYIHSEESEYMFNVYTLKDIHKSLYSTTEHPEFGGEFRKHDVYLPGTGTELTEWSMIRYELNKLDPEITGLVEMAPEIRECGDAELLLAYMDECVTVGCKLIKIHPFGDGNGRAVRGFTNKMLEYVGLPPIYIKANERTEYHKAMNKANNEGDYTDIRNFYRYKVCDSIVELDINPRLRRQMNGEDTEDKVSSSMEEAVVKSKADDIKRKSDE